jgi:AraC family transcriptional regulator
MTEGAFGSRLGSSFNIKFAPVVVSLTARKASLALTELRSDVRLPYRTRPLHGEDAFLVTLHMTDNPGFRVREANHDEPVCRLDAGQITIHDLKHCPSFLIDSPFHTLNFYLPRLALDEVADNAEAPRIGNLDYQPGRGIRDETIRNLIGTMSLSFTQPAAVGRLCVGHAGLALATHLAHAYGGLVPDSRPIRGGLAPWQEKRAKDLINARLNSGMTVAELARECDLSHRHFCRAFRHSVGSSPHSYMQVRRIELAKELLGNGHKSLGDVGASCGFADQSHFTRVFTQIAGMTPGMWRRNVGRGKAEDLFSLPEMTQTFARETPLP